MKSDEGARREDVLALARWSEELPALIATRREAGARRVALVGISMGGYAALAAWSRRHAVDAVAVALAGFQLVEERGEAPLLVGLAGQDTAVSFEPACAAATRHGATLHTYPASGHFMRGDDWHHLWSETARFVGRHIAAEAATMVP